MRGELRIFFAFSVQCACVCVCVEQVWECACHFRFFSPFLCMLTGTNLLLSSVVPTVEPPDIVSFKYDYYFSPLGQTTYFYIFKPPASLTIPNAKQSNKLT